MACRASGSALHTSRALLVGGCSGLRFLYQTGGGDAVALLVVGGRRGGGFIRPKAAPPSADLLAVLLPDVRAEGGDACDDGEDGKDLRVCRDHAHKLRRQPAEGCADAADLSGQCAEQITQFCGHRAQHFAHAAARGQVRNDLADGSKGRCTFFGVQHQLAAGQQRFDGVSNTRQSAACVFVVDDLEDVARPRCDGRALFRVNFAPN